MSATALGIDQPASEQDQISEHAASLLASKPRLRKHVSVQTQHSRGETWWVLENNETGSSYRLDADAYNIVISLNGEVSVNDLIASVAEAEPGGEQQALSFISQLQNAGLLQHAGNSPSDLQPEERQVAAVKNASIKLKNLLSIRIPLWDPDEFLNALTPKLNHFATSYTKFAIIAALLLGLAATWQHVGALSVYGLARAGELSSLLLLLMVYPFIKAIHELAHAYSIKRHGGEVHEMGIMLLVFFPVPYVDASASAAFSEKAQRIEVATAGILAELVLAALAIFLWAHLHQGLLSDIAFSIAIVGGLSTLLFNGNPLLRFDGYFAFSDWLEIPNLASRSRAYCGYLVRRLLLRVDDLITPVTARGEAGWFVGYFLASSSYRLLILLGIAIYLIKTLPLLGMLLAVVAISNQIVLPVYKNFHYLASHPELSSNRTQATATVVGILSLIVIATCLIPLPNWSALPGVVRMPETSTVRATESGFISSMIVSDGSLVSQGETIALLENADLVKESTRLQWYLKELEARRTAIIMESPSEAAQIGESIKSANSELADVKRRVQRMTVTAPASGQLQYLENADWLGRFVEEGSAFAYVISSDERRIILVAPESSIADIRLSTTTAWLRSNDRPGVSVPAEIIAITPAGSRRLPNAALGSRHGGAIAVDARDDSGKNTLEQVFQIELAPASGFELRPGSGVVARFELQTKTLSAQLKAASARLLMKEVQW